MGLEYSHVWEHNGIVFDGVPGDAEIYQWTCCGGSDFSLPEDCSRIVIDVMNRSFLHLCGHCQDILVTYQAGQFQVAVIDSAIRIGKGHQLTLNPRQETLSPQEWSDGAVRRGNKVYIPILVPAVSHVPMVAGTRSGINLAIIADRIATSLASQQTSLRKPCRNFERFKRGRIESS